MMDTLISGFAEDYRRQFINSDGSNDQLDHPLVSPTGNFTNKLSKFTLATFDDEGNETQNWKLSRVFKLFYIYFSKLFQVDALVKWARGPFNKYIVQFVMSICVLLDENKYDFCNMWKNFYPS